MYYLTLLAAAGTIIFFDQMSKFYIRQILSPGDSLPIVKGIFHLTYLSNPGGAFGILPIYPFLLIVSLMTIGLIIFYSRKVQPKSIVQGMSLGFVLGGAVGNLIDRLSWGRVIDFLDFRIWPVFNLADSAIVIGSGMLIAFWLKELLKIKN